MAAVYLVAGWAAVQIAATVQPFLSLPPKFVTVVIVLVGLGFPVAIGMAWAFDVTPEGLRRAPATSEAAVAGAASPVRWLRVVALLVVLVSASIALGVLRQRRSGDRTPAAGAGVTAAAAVDPAASAPDLASIAVLPFQNLSEQKSNEYFSDGITDEILANLARLSEVKVISRTSVMQYRNTTKSLREIGHELGVATVLEGSVQQVAGRVLIVAQLIDARTDRHLWADRYDRELKDVFAVEADVAEKIAQALKAQLTPAEHTRLAVQPTENPEAHRLYLQGRAAWYRESEPDLRRAAQLFQDAIDLDPAYALAYCGLSDAHGDLARYGDRRAHMEQARVLARKAIALDSTLGEPHDALGFILMTFDYDLAGAERELRRSLALKPGYAVTHYDLGTALQYQRRLPEALRERLRAAALDPLTPWVALGPARMLLAMGHPQEALAAAGRVVPALRPHWLTPLLVGDIYRRLGRFDAAAAEYQRAIQIAGPDEAARFIHPRLALNDVASGRRARAEQAYGRLAASGATDAVILASLAAQLGRKDDAFALLDQAYQERSEDLLTLPYDPDLAPLRGDPRFAALARKVGVR